MFSPVISVSSSSLPAFLKLFSAPPRFVCFISFDSSKRVFYTHRSKTSFSLALPSLSFHFLPSFLLLFSLSLSFLPSLPFFFFYLSLQVFGAVTAAMPHRFRQACSRSHPSCINKPGKALPRTNVNHLLIIAPSNKHADCKIAYTTISTTLFACLS